MQSLASLFPCQIGVTWTLPPTRESREDREPSVYSRIPLCKLGDSASADWSLCAAPILRGEPRLSANFRRVLSLQIKEFRSRSSHLNAFTFLPTVFFSTR